MYFNSIRWLSCGQVLNRFCDLFAEIENFLREEDLDGDFNDISTFEWKQQLYFLCDITNHLNDLNLKLQGKNKFIWELAKDIQEFKLNLTSFKEQIGDNDFTFFERLRDNEFKDDEIYVTELFITSLDKLIAQINSRFTDFEKFRLVFKFLRNPFIFDENDVEELANLFETMKNHLKLDIALINKETYLSNEKSAVAI